LTPHVGWEPSHPQATITPRTGADPSLPFLTKAQPTRQLAQDGVAVLNPGGSPVSVGPSCVKCGAVAPPKATQDHSEGDPQLQCHVSRATG